MDELKRLKSKQLALKKHELHLKENLPHRNLFPFYKWSRQFYESRNEVNLLCAANQISKSSTQIRKCIEWATNKDLWPELWPGKTVNQFWYLYPTADVATAEFEKKWMQFLPKGELKEDEVYGWKAIYERKKIKELRFGTDVSIYFKTYAQDVQSLQSGSVFAMFTDEELPEELLDELMLRLAAVDGYFHMVFTATLNQEFWKRAIEPTQRDTEVFPDALKLQVSMYDCLEYEDGSETPWSLEKIKKVESKCKSQTEIDRRVKGKFVTEEGRIYGAFDPTRHYIKPVPIPTGWHIYSGTDIGSGGKNHPPASTFVAVNPTYTLGYVFKHWRGDDGKEWTNGEVFNKNLEMRGQMKPIMQTYDGAAKDFGTIATRAGESFVKAEKGHEVGESIVNTLFKNDMLFVFDDEVEDEKNECQGRKLGGELSSLLKSTPKNKRKDDSADSLRYCVVSIPWDFESIKIILEELLESKKPEAPKTREDYLAEEIRARRGELVDERKTDNDWTDTAQEIDYWNEQYG